MGNRAESVNRGEKSLKKIPNIGEIEKNSEIIFWTFDFSQFSSDFL